jgi:hypothetical protein
MEEVLMKHNVHKEAVNELINEQERHQKVIEELRKKSISTLKHVNTDGTGTVARDVAWAQNKHHVLMKEIAKKHQLKHVTTRELDAVHTHHLSLVHTIIQDEENDHRNDVKTLRDDGGDGGTSQLISSKVTKKRRAPPKPPLALGDKSNGDAPRPPPLPGPPPFHQLMPPPSNGDNLLTGPPPPALPGPPPTADNRRGTLNMLFGNE